MANTLTVNSIVDDAKGGSSQFPNQFQQETLKLINTLLDITSSAFYLVNPEVRCKGVALSNLGIEVELSYHKKFKTLDPLEPEKFANTNDTVITIDSQISFSLLKQTRYYQEFMQPNNHRYVADMFFRSDNASN